MMQKPSVGTLMLGKPSLAAGNHNRQQREQLKGDGHSYPPLVVIGDASMPVTPLIFPVINSATTIITNVSTRKQLNTRRDPALVRAERYTISVGSDGVPISTQMPLARRSPTKSRNLRNFLPNSNTSTKSPARHSGVEGSDVAHGSENGHDSKPNPPAAILKERDGNSIRNKSNPYINGNPHKCNPDLAGKGFDEKLSPSSSSISHEASSRSTSSPAQVAGAALGKALGLSFEPKNVIRVLQDVQSVNKEVKLTKISSSPQISRSMDQSSLRSTNVHEQDVNSKNKRPAPPAVSSASNIKVVYRYKHVAGNNGRVILSNFRKRPWWHSGNDKTKMRGLPMDGDIAKASKEADDSCKKKESLNFDFVWEMCRNPKRYANEDYCSIVLNHLESNIYLVSKKHLYFSIRDYYASLGKDPLDIIPRTFYLAPNAEDTRGELSEFTEYNRKCDDSSNDIYEGNSTSAGKKGKKDEGLIWIAKPASYANRGYGIKVTRGLKGTLAVVGSASKYTGIETEDNKNPSTDDIKPSTAESCRSDVSDDTSSAASDVFDPTDPTNLKRRAKNIGKSNGWIVQEYMTNPLLVSGKKFDIRCFVLITNSTKEGFKAFWFKEGYIRTSCKKYSLDKLNDRETHLTNDAVQKHSKSYGDGSSSKLTYAQWQDCINKDYPGTPGDIVINRIVPEIRELSKIAILAALEKGLSKTKIQKSFELLGYDYMITSDFKPILIEVNTNPCLEFACPLLEQLIGKLIDNVWSIAVDKFFPPPPSAERTRRTEEAVQAIQQEEQLFESLYEEKARK